MKSPQICNINILGYTLDNYKIFNKEGYVILCSLGEASYGFSYFPNTSKIVLDTGQQSKLINNFEKLVPYVAKDLGITQQDALDKSVKFF